jgi:hypothetical protein
LQNKVAVCDTRKDSKVAHTVSTLSVPISFRFLSCSKTDIRVSLACDDVLKGKWFPSSYGPSSYGKYELKLTLTSLLQLDEDSNSFMSYI